MPNHMLAAYVGEGEAVSDRASDDYVRSVLDSFAGSSDQVVHGLDYRVPTLVAETWKQLLGPGGLDLRVLDVGCGTGPCGTARRAYADWHFAFVCSNRNRPFIDRSRETIDSSMIGTK